jgi:hypothetical protein
MRMGDCRCQCVGGIGLHHSASGQKAAHHELHLFFAGMTRTHHAFLDLIGRIFRDLRPASAPAKSATARA